MIVDLVVTTKNIEIAKKQKGKKNAYALNKHFQNI
jgi:hypothetical protein